MAASSCSRLDTQPVGEREQEVLGGEVLVGELRPLLVGGVEDLLQLAAHARLAAVGLGQLADGLVGGVAHASGARPTALEDRQDDALLLAQERRQQVVGGDLGVVLGLGRVDGAADRLLGLLGPAVRVEGHLSRAYVPTPKLTTTPQVFYVCNMAPTSEPGIG